MRKIIFISFLLLLSKATTSLGQIAQIKSEIDQLFFKIPLMANKFEIRTVLNSNDIFFDIWNYDTTSKAISASFKNNLKLSFLANSYHTRMAFWFEKGKENTHSRKIVIDYRESELQKCISQYKEIISFFQTKSFKTNEGNTLNFKEEQNGVWTAFFSSLKSFSKSNYYLNVGYRYCEPYVSEAFSQSKNYYIIEIILTDKNIY